MYCHLIVYTGWTWEYIDAHMDVPRLLAMRRFWQKYPPLRDMVQAYLGIKTMSAKASSKQEIQNTPQDLHDFMKMFAAAGGRTG